MSEAPKFQTFERIEYIRKTAHEYTSRAQKLRDGGYSTSAEAHEKHVRDVQDFCLHVWVNGACALDADGTCVICLKEVAK